MDRRSSFPERLEHLQREFAEVVRAWHPDAAAVEAPFHGASARAALQLAHARGVILAALAAQNVPVVEYSPAVIKKTVAGNGRAEKLQVQEMVRHALGRQAPTLTSDLADALAAALCHLAHARFADAVRRSDLRRR
jgi:crossover junction endodeoxyribonuclease RuvC